MRIINLFDPDWNIEAPLLTMASNVDRFEAFKGRKLLELIRHLQAKGGTEAFGHMLLGELHLSPRDSTVTVQVAVDWYDYAPLENDLPVGHYRLQIRRKDTKRSEDARAATLKDAERIILDAFESAG